MKKTLLLGFIAVNTALAQTVSYKVEMTNPQEHYFYITMKVEGWKKNTVDVKMPVWAPGSYLIREFSKNVDYVKANANGTALNCSKIDKNTWQIETNGKPSVTIQYNVYAYELSVRTSFLDASHGFISGSSVFMYLPEMKSSGGQIEIVLPKEFKTISTAMSKNGNGFFQFSTIDELYDSPFEIGNHIEFEFISEGCKHRVAMYGEASYSIDKLKTDMAKVTTECTKVWGENPNKEYLFIIHNLTVGSGGLEHASSCCLQVNRNTYSGNAYTGFLSLVAHEYFHLWNVKRLRPSGLWPYDYDKENYTDMLWVSEGFTSYYDELLIKRAGFYDEGNYIRSLNSSLASVENTPGNKIQSLSESSFDAWIKSYRPNENSNNRTISYYPKGALAAALLDIEIIRSTSGKFKLDDLLKKMYNDFYKVKKQGFTMNDFKSYAENICNKKLDDFFNVVVNGTNEINYNSYFASVGYSLSVNNRSAEPWLGISTKDVGGKCLVGSVTDLSCAQKGGINVNDEIIAINKQRIDNSSLLKTIALYTTGTKIEVLISRDNLLQTLFITLERSNQKDYSIYAEPETNDNAKKFRNKWLN